VRRALRRLGSLLLTLFVTSLCALWALSALERREPAARSLPNFFNPAPRSARSLSEAALAALAKQDDATAALELARLGGAALPHLLPRFESLPKLTRERVASALVPVAYRMGIAAPGEITSPSQAAQFWDRFWQDREMDFRPQLVRRLVMRLAEKSSVLRGEDVIQLDTYALPELVGLLEPPGDDAGVQRARRLTAVLAHVTGLPWRVEAETTPAAAAQVVWRWKRFWLESGADFTSPEGAHQVAAMFMQTRYARWLRGFVTPAEGGPFGLTALALRRSLLVALFAALVSLGGGALLTRASLGRNPRGAALAQAAGVFFASAPVLLWIAVFGVPAAVFGRELLSVLVAAVPCAAALSILAVRALTRDDSRQWSVLFAYLALSLPSILPWLFTSLFSLEVVLDLESAGRTALNGARTGDLRPGMSLALGAALAVALFSANAARIAARCNSTRSAPALIEVGSARARRALIARLAWCGALLALAALSLRATGTNNAVLVLARSLVVFAVITTAVAAALGLSLGALRVRPSRALDSFLSRAVEVRSALPAVVWAAAAAALWGGGVWLAIALGALRALDVAWMYRTELVRSSVDSEIYAFSGRPTPDPVSFRTRRSMAGTARASLALTPAWGAALGVAASLLGLSPERAGWQMLSLSPFNAAAGIPLSLGLLAITSAVLLGWMAPRSRQLGAIRASWPPPIAGEPPPSSRRWNAPE
jgi:hypothetical protein